MSKLQLLNAFLTERLTAAAVEIFGAVEEAIVEYQDEIYRSKKENKRLQKLLDLVLNPEIKLHRADRGQITISFYEDEVLHEQKHSEQEWRQGQEHQDSTQIKKERESTQTTEEQEPDTKTPSYVEDLRQITISVCKDDVPHEQRHSEQKHSEQEWSPDLGQEHQDSTQITEEREPDTKTPSYVESKDSLQPLLHIDQIPHVEVSVIQTEPGENGHAVSEQTSDSHLLSAVNPDYSETVYSCDICNKSYGIKKRLTMHMRLHAETQCHFCQKPFQEKSLKVHMKIHKRERPYSCNICEKHFKRNSHLIEHFRTHSGEKPYRCHVCGKYFSTRSNMKAHVKARHGDFIKRGNLTKHMTTHTG